MDLRGFALRPTRYMLRAGPVDAEAFRLKNWQLQGSSDGLEWVVLHNHEGRRHSTTLAGEKKHGSLSRLLCFTAFLIHVPSLLRQIIAFHGATKLSQAAPIVLLCSLSSPCSQATMRQAAGRWTDLSTQKTTQP